jgi:hypothetical protein
MSRRNGDRSRFNRLRKQKIHKRTVSAAIVSGSGTGSVETAIAATPKAAKTPAKS